MRTFPIMLNIAGRLATVVGGGRVGLRKVNSLLRGGAKVRLATQTGSPDIEPQVNLEIILTPYTAELLKGSSLVFACTADRALNSQIARDARQIGAWVNAADQPDDCDFFLPATTRRGDVVLAVGTGGDCPALAARLREQLEAALPKKIGEFSALLGQIRLELRCIIDDEHRRGEILKTLSQDDVYLDFAGNGEQAVRLRLKQLLA